MMLQPSRTAIHFDNQKEDDNLKKTYMSPELDLVKLKFESLLESLNDSQPNIPIEGGDGGEDQ